METDTPVLRMGGGGELWRLTHPSSEWGQPRSRHHRHVTALGEQLMTDAPQSSGDISTDIQVAPLWSGRSLVRVCLV